jgi:hypothetical protein
VDVPLKVACLVAVDVGTNNMQPVNQTDLHHVIGIVGHVEERYSNMEDLRTCPKIHQPFFTYWEEIDLMAIPKRRLID